MYNLDVTDKGERDLDKIIAYIVEDLDAPQAAASFVDEVYECYDRLEDNPYIYEECRDPRLQKEGYRRAVIKSYIMLYKIHEDDNMVIVHRFFYGRQDYVNLI